MRAALNQGAILNALNPEGGGDNFLGRIVEVAIVTADCRKVMTGLSALGIAPWRVYTFSPENTKDQTYRGRPAEFSMRVCFAQSGDMVWEVIQPLSGPTIFQDFLDGHGEGIHHVAYDCNDMPFHERLQELERRGFNLAQSGSWEGKCHFAFFETEGATTTCFETYAFDVDWEYPEPDEWFGTTLISSRAAGHQRD